VSERGWIDFLHAEGVDDWVVLHGGAMAVFRVGSLGEAADLAAAFATVPDLGSIGTILTIAADRVTVRLTRGVFQLERAHVERARAVSAIARSRGVASDRSAAQEVQVAISARPDDIDVGFWRAVLGYDPRAEDNATDPLGHGSTVWMQDLDPSKPLRHAMHVDVSVARDHAEARVAAALAAGGTLVDDTGAPEGWILADRAGNKVCIAAWPDGATRPAT
jgi:4a-hydroxytetrahydrobiopterin dehydratase